MPALLVGAGPCAAPPRVPLVLTPAWGPRGPKPTLRFLPWRGPLRGSAARPACAHAGLGAPPPQAGAPLSSLARAPARLRRASRLCSRRLGGPAAPSRRCASFIGAGPCAASPRVPLVCRPAGTARGRMLAPTWGPRCPKPALRCFAAGWGRAVFASRGRRRAAGASAPAKLRPPRLAAFRAYFSRRQSGAAPASRAEKSSAWPGAL